jgi:O-antigen ligase
LTLIAVFFVLMLVFPTTLQMQRGVMLAALFAIGVLGANSQWSVSWDILLLWLFVTCVGTFGIFWGFLNGAPGALQVSTVYLVWPLVYMLFVGLVHSPRTIVFLEKALLFGITVASLMALILLLGTVLGYGEFVVEFFAFQGANIRIFDGFVELTLFNLATVIYGLPFLFALYFSPDARGWLKSRRLLGLQLLLLLAICLVSGRRAFWLLAIFTPILVWVLFFLARVRFRATHLAITVMFVFVLSIGGAVGLGLDFSVLLDQFLLAFDFSGEVGASLRFQQFTALMSGWSESPLIGHGLGAAEKSISRSKEIVWAYELSYVALLFQAGLLGFAVYSAAVLWIFYAGINIVRRRQEAAQVILPLLAGLAGFLLVNATNPYLSKFDYLWTIFLPVAAINAYKTEK